MLAVFPRIRDFISLSFCACLISLAAISARAQGVYITGLPISFGNLTGPNLSPFTGSVEGSFIVSPTSGDWLEGIYYGNPGPSILLGPLNGPASGVIQITDTAGEFTMAGLDFSSNNGDSTYDIEGFQGATLAYQETGALPGTFGPFSFSTLSTANPNLAIDALLIEIIPGNGATSVNLDNIEVQTVPEPDGFVLAGLSLAGFIGLRIWTKRQTASGLRA